MRRPQRSTLFPYTTLFRSTRLLTHVAEIAQHHHRDDGLGRVGHGLRGRLPGRSRLGLHLLHLDDEIVRLVEEGEDRKSTRLNSSHVEISYAVFCLKKKNKN